MSIVELFCRVDDFCQQFGHLWLEEQHMLVRDFTKRKKSVRRRGRMCESELVALMIAFHQSNYRTFKHFYTQKVLHQWHRYFPKAVSYQRFVELKQRTAFPLGFFLVSLMGKCSGLSFIDSTPIVVCHNLRIPSHRVFDGLAARGKNSMGWFYGFKLHIVVNDMGELLAVRLTPGNVDDRAPVDDLAKDLFGKLFGDKGYISKALSDRLFERGVQLITRLRKNMKQKLLPQFDRLLLRKRAIIETINDQLKNISQIEHTRHRSPKNFVVNLLAGLIAYCLQPKKPTINLRDIEEIQALTVL